MIETRFLVAPQTAMQVAAHPPRPLALANEPILARPVGRAERLWRWCRRNPRAAITAAAVALLVLGWAVTMSVLSVRLDRQKKETETARDVARENEQLALARAKLANQQHENAVFRLTNVGEEMLKRLRSRRLILKAGPEMAALRDELLNVLREGMTTLAKDLEETRASTFGMVGVHQHVGDILKRLGKGEQAFEQFKKGYELARAIAAEQPASDLAQANFSVMLQRMGDMELELHGDARAARDWYQQALDRRLQVAEHPHGDQYSELDNKIALSHDEPRLGQAELELGNPAAAREHFQKAVELRKAWAEAVPQADNAKSYLVQAYLGLGTAAWHLGGAAAADEAFAQAERIQKGLIARNPDAVWYREDLAEVQGARGDALLRRGDVEGAQKSYEESFKNLQAALARNAEETDWQVVLALTHERLAALDVRQGRAAEAAKHYQEALRVRGELVQIEPNNLSWQAAYLRALAHAGKGAEAAPKAEALCRENPKSTPLLLEAARCYAACAAGAAAPANRERYAAKAIEAVRAAAAAGYKDPIALRTDPDLAPVQTEQAFRDLLDAMTRG
jgi:tetratricopeptide (TPR) repeat protein